MGEGKAGSMEPFGVSRLLSRVYWYVVTRERDGRETIVATFTEEADAQRRAKDLNASFRVETRVVLPENYPD